MSLSLFARYGLTRAPSGGGSDAGDFGVATTSTGRGDADTTHTITYPTGTAIGSTIIILFHQLSTLSTITAPTGYSTVASQNPARVFGRKLETGDSVTSTTVATSAARASVWVAIRVPQANGFEGAAPGFNTNDPPNLTPSWGAGEHLWLALASKGRTDSTYTAAPIGFGGFSNFKSTESSVVNNSEGEVAWASLIENASSKNPSAFTVSGSVTSNTAFTVAVRAA